jgi:hypothetical protein
MIKHFDLKVSVRQQRRRQRLSALTNHARRYKSTWAQDELSQEKLQACEDYDFRHNGKTIGGFRRFAYVSDDFHLGLTVESDPYLRREEGTKHHEENIVTRNPKEGVTYYLIGFVN